MSTKALNMAFEIEIEPSDKMQLIVLADNADDTFQCFPSYGRIAKRACVSKRTAIRTIEKFVKCELIEKLPRFKDNRQRSNIYKLTFYKFNQKRYIEETPIFKKKLINQNKRNSGDKLALVSSDVTNPVPPDVTQNHHSKEINFYYAYYADDYLENLEKLQKSMLNKQIAKDKAKIKKEIEI
ncbi:helix-turn-helix domain-containing protein [Arcobacter sp.]|uniref:helix-turn-helix domain-containing protein n=1 Tax=unclassified Arcobacter TaxID=2593671 RepID=UPI003B007409